MGLLGREAGKMANWGLSRGWALPVHNLDTTLHSSHSGSHELLLLPRLLCLALSSPLLELFKFPLSFQDNSNPAFTGRTNLILGFQSDPPNTCNGSHMAWPCLTLALLQWVHVCESHLANDLLLSVGPQQGSADSQTLEAWRIFVV